MAEVLASPILPLQTTAEVPQTATFMEGSAFF